MPWFRVDDNFAFHSKVMIAGNDAVGVWARAGSWSMQQLTDGFVPSAVVEAMGGKRATQRLVEAGLWLIEDGGYQFHEWGQRQPSRAHLETEREKTRKRVERYRGQMRERTTRSEGHHE